MFLASENMISMSGELYFLLSETIVFRKPVDTGGTSAFKEGPEKQFQIREPES